LFAGFAGPPPKQGSLGRGAPASFGPPPPPPSGPPPPPYSCQSPTRPSRGAVPRSLIERVSPPPPRKPAPGNVPAPWGETGGGGGGVSPGVPRPCAGDRVTGADPNLPTLRNPQNGEIIVRRPQNKAKLGAAPPKFFFGKSRESFTPFSSNESIPKGWPRKSPFSEIGDIPAPPVKSSFTPPKPPFVFCFRAHVGGGARPRRPPPGAGPKFTQIVRAPRAGRPPKIPPAPHPPPPPPPARPPGL